ILMAQPPHVRHFLQCQYHRTQNRKMGTEKFEVRSSIFDNLSVSIFLFHPQRLQPSSARCFQSSCGRKIPAGVIMPVTKSGGVTSKPGLRAPLDGLATRTYSRFFLPLTPHAPRTSDSLRSSIGIAL